MLAKLQGFDKRTIQEPSIEYSIRGPKESFTETLNTNTSLLRRRIRSSKLKLQSFTVGELTRTGDSLGVNCANDAVVRITESRCLL
ncbi:spore germination protein [Paenibacillus marchantiophytorum]|uniref:spore germination protein n=1 Tax=Paenibacillus marchantiophytorum TaxID=1619310 RepID=UPI00166B2CE8